MIIKNQVLFQYLLHGSVADKDARLTDVDAVTAIEMWVCPVNIFLWLIWKGIFELLMRAAKLYYFGGGDYVIKIVIFKLSK